MTYHSVMVPEPVSPRPRMDLATAMSAYFQPRILILGGTGVTGRLILKQLSNSNVSLTVAGRSLGKLERLRLDFPQIQIAEIDLANGASLDRLLTQHLIVINCVGPYLK